MKIEVLKTANYRLIENGKTVSVLPLTKGLYDLPYQTTTGILTDSIAKQLIKTTSSIKKVSKGKE